MKRIIGIFISLCISVSCLGAPVFAADEDKILLEEHFDFAADESGSDVGAWNGWIAECGDLNKYTLDSKYYLGYETDSENGVGCFYRSASGASSAAYMVRHDLSKPAEGGTISAGLRIMRTNNAARLFVMRLYDTAGNMMGFIIDLQNSRIYSENGGAFKNYYFPGITKNTQSPLGVWQSLEWQLDFENGTFNCFYAIGGGEKTEIAHDFPIVSTNNGSMKSIVIGTQRNANGADALFLADDVCVTVEKAPMTDEEACELAAEEYRAALSQPLEKDAQLLPKGIYNTTIDWKSSDENVITSGGKVTRLYKQDGNAVLTAVFSRGSYSAVKKFAVTVKGLDEYITPTAEIMREVADGFSFSVISNDSENAVYNSLRLIDSYNALAASAIGGVKVAWECDSEAVSADGSLNKTGENQKVALKARFTSIRDESLKSEKTFALAVLPRGDAFLYETFDSPESTEGQDVDGWNGWKMSYGDAAVYVMDSYFTVKTEDKTDNKTLSLFRPTCTNQSMYVTATKTLEKTLDGGTANLRLRIKKKNSAARLMMLQFTDNASHRMEFCIDLAASRIYSGGMNTPAFKTFYFPGITQNTPAPENTWMELEFVLKLDEQTFDCLFNGAVIAEDYPIIAGNNGTLASITLGTHRTVNTGGNAEFLVDDISLVQTGEKIADEEACRAVIRMLRDEYENKSFDSDCEFETSEKYKTTAVWSAPDSENVKIRRNIMTVTPQASDSAAVLTVSVYRNQSFVTAEIPITIAAMEGKRAPDSKTLETIARHFDFSEISDEAPDEITQKLKLIDEYTCGEAARIGGADILWSSSKPYVIGTDGEISQYQYDVPMQLTATFSAKDDPSVTAEKTFNVTVLSRGEVLFEEDFEAAQPADMYKTIDYNGWTLSRGDLTHIAASDAVIEFDSAKSGNKLLHVTRTMRNSGTPPYAAYQLIQKSFDREITDGTLYFTMRFMITNQASRVSMIIHDSFGTSAGKSIQISKYYAGGIKLGTPLSENRWYTAAVIFRMNTSGSGSHRYDLFIDGKKVYADGFNSVNNYPLTAFSIYSERNSDGPDSSWYVDDISVRRCMMNCEKDVEEAYDALDIDASLIETGDLELPSAGKNAAAIKWLTSDASVVSESGKIYRGSESKTAELTAVITRGDAQRRKSYKITVPSGSGENNSVLHEFLTDGGKIKGVRMTCGGDNRILFVLAYDRGSLCAVREVKVGGGDSSAEFEPIELSAHGSCRAYIWDCENSITDSNILYGRGN